VSSTHVAWPGHGEVDAISQIVDPDSEGLRAASTRCRRPRARRPDRLAHGIARSLLATPGDTRNGLRPKLRLCPTACPTSAAAPAPRRNCQARCGPGAVDSGPYRGDRCRLGSAAYRLTIGSRLAPRRAPTSALRVRAPFGGASAHHPELVDEGAEEALEPNLRASGALQRGERHHLRVRADPGRRVGAQAPRAAVVGPRRERRVAGVVGAARPRGPGSSAIGAASSPRSGPAAVVASGVAGPHRGSGGETQQGPPRGRGADGAAGHAWAPRHIARPREGASPDA
jgi:hypothetical protein